VIPGQPEFPPLIKPYYRIGEVARLLDESTPTVRYWQAEFAIRDERSKKGQRVFSRKAVSELFEIRDLLRNWRFTIAGARAFIRGVTTRRSA
jgi:DNA-binding transcriptional MerR regulator